MVRAAWLSWTSGMCFNFNHDDTDIVNGSMPSASSSHPARARCFFRCDGSSQRRWRANHDGDGGWTWVECQWLVGRDGCFKSRRMRARVGDERPKRAMYVLCRADCISSLNTDVKTSLLSSSSGSTLGEFISDSITGILPSQAGGASSTGPGNETMHSQRGIHSPVAGSWSSHDEIPFVLLTVGTLPEQLQRLEPSIAIRVATPLPPPLYRTQFAGQSRVASLQKHDPLRCINAQVIHSPSVNGSNRYDPENPIPSKTTSTFKFVEPTTTLSKLSIAPTIAHVCK